MTRARSTFRIAISLAACAGLLVSCSSSGGAHVSASSSSSSSASSSATGGSTVQVKGYAFSPTSLTVAKGTKVTWKFDDGANHNVTASDKSFKSRDLHSGGSYSFTFNTAGTYQYACSIHPFMKASITVK